MDNDILDNNPEEKQAVLHYQSLAYKLVDFLWRNATTPSDTSDREPLMALLKNPKMNTKNKSLIALANLLQDMRTDKITQAVIESYSPLSWLSKDVIKISIGKYLEKKHRVALGAKTFGLFNAFISELGLLKLVTNGSETSANLLLRKENPRAPLVSSILKKGNVTDPAGRMFKNISSLQAAYWMRDWYMVDMLLSHLSKEALIDAQNQINDVKNRCVEYHLYLDIDAGVDEKDFAVQHLAPVMLPQDNVEYRVSLPPENYDYTHATPIPDGKRRVLVSVIGEQYYDYQPLIKALKDFLAVYNPWQQNRWVSFIDNNVKAQVIHHWCKIVGLVQRYATAFLAQQYCRPDRPCEDVNFDEREFKHRSFNLYNYAAQQFTSWFLPSSGLGDSFGVLPAWRGRRCAEGGVGTRELLGYHEDDIATVEQLDKKSSEKMATVLDKYFSGLSQTMRIISTNL